MRERRDLRSRVHGNSRMRQVRSSMLHVHHEAESNATKGKKSKPEWVRDWEAVKRLRDFCERMRDFCERMGH
jgi:hypothetical protein